MKILRKLAFALSLGAAAATLGVGSAQAQVNGIATVDPARAIAASQARQTAYQQISQAYSTQIQQLNTARQELNALTQQLDTNGDGQVSDQEVATAQGANNPVLQQIQTKQNQIDTIQDPIARAQLYALEQITQEYNNAQQQVISDRQISIILTPDSFVYAPDSVDVTAAVAAALNARIPTVSYSAPAEWQPSRQTAALHQQVQEMLVFSALAQQQQQQQQQGQQPATQPPQGR